MHRLEFYFDCSSPWTYLAFERALALFDPKSVELMWKPILVGGVFNAVNPGVYDTRTNPVPAKLSYSRKDLQDWAGIAGLVIGQPPVFPVNSVKVMRGAFYALEHGVLVEYARAVLKRYWTDLADISQDGELRTIVMALKLDVDEFFTAIGTQAYKDRLRETTDELMRRGGFGSPTMYLDGDDMYFGNDRLELIKARVDRHLDPDT